MVLKAPALIVGAALLMSACGGSDSTGPTSLDSASALQSLAIGLNQIGGTESPVGTETNATFAAIAPVLDKVTITINGATQGMYALGLRESFPEGTCEETIFIDPEFPPEPGVCTPPALGVEMVLWQTQSATEPPDKLIVIGTDVGTSSLDFTSGDLPAFAIYVGGQNKIYVSESGTLTTQVTASNQSCSIALPAYAKTGTCSFATFTSQGSVGMSEFTANGAATATLGIPSVTMHGLWLNVTEVQPVPITAIRTSTFRLMSRLTATQRLPATSQR